LKFGVELIGFSCVRLIISFSRSLNKILFSNKLFAELSMPNVLPTLTNDLGSLNFKTDSTDFFDLFDFKKFPKNRFKSILNFSQSGMLSIRFFIISSQSSLVRKVLLIFLKLILKGISCFDMYSF
jgi:hypothetical protein